MPIIIVSNQDLAGQTIKSQLLKIGNFIETEKKFEGNIIYEESETKVPIISIERRLIEADHLNQFFKTDLIIFASKHKSESEKPSLLVHAPGNWKEDISFGGNAYELALTSGGVIKEILVKLNIKEQEAQLGYDVTSEVTHHGPTNLHSPCVFVELGSNEKFWQDSQGGRIVAETIIELITGLNSRSNLKYAIGFGGSHYASNFNKIQLYTEYAISHIAPKYVLDDINENLIIQSIKKTVEKVDYAILDWKGMNSLQREKIIEILNKLKIKVLKVHKILEKIKKI